MLEVKLSLVARAGPVAVVDSVVEEVIDSFEASEAIEVKAVEEFVVYDVVVLTADTLCICRPLAETSVPRAKAPSRRRVPIATMVRALSVLSMIV